MSREKDRHKSHYSRERDRVSVPHWLAFKDLCGHASSQQTQHPMRELQQQWPTCCLTTQHACPTR